MTDKIKTAVILAAGLGSRLGNMTKAMPKGFLRLGKKPIIEESIEKLLGAGIKKIVLVTGYQARHYENLASNYSEVKTVINPIYDCSGSLYSLSCARDDVNEDFLLLESDLIYEKRALSELIDHERADVILVSGLTHSGDEVFVEVEEHTLVNLSKDRSELKDVFGEFVGINKVSRGLFAEMIQRIKKEDKKTHRLDYETDGFAALAKHNRIYCYKLDDLKWCEIDNEKHYQIAINQIYPSVSQLRR